VAEAQLAAVTARVQDDALTKDLGSLRERVALVEARPVLTSDPALGELREQVKGLDCRGEIAALRERAAVLETRAPVPGPAGERGEKGSDGRNGTVEDLRLKCVPVTERSFQLYAGDGVPIEGGLIAFDVELYRGVYVDGKTYDRGDGVTWGGSEWHCNETTTSKPGEGSKAWTLKVKRGRDGKDGRDAPSVPVVSVGGRP
jgi:hypothetical protein